MCQNGELNRYLKTTRKRLTENEGTPSCYETVSSSFGLGTCFMHAIAWKPVRFILLCLQLGGSSSRWYKVSSTCTHTRSYTGTSVSPTCCSPEPWMPYVLGCIYNITVHSTVTVCVALSIAVVMLQKIADFGLAAQLKRADEKHYTMCGTPNYIAP